MAIDVKITKINDKVQAVFAYKKFFRLTTSDSLSVVNEIQKDGTRIIPGFTRSELESFKNYFGNSIEYEMTEVMDEQEKKDAEFNAFYKEARNWFDGLPEQQQKYVRVLSGGAYS